MNNIVIASIRKNAGKTSIIAGIISHFKNIKFAYAKPLGDRLIYRRKKSWDYDASLMINLLGREGELESRFEKITLGFDHSKLRYMYDEAGIKKALSDMVTEIGGSNDVMFLESGKDLESGSYLNLDALSMAKYVNARLVVIVSGDSDFILDDIKFIEKYVKIKDNNFAGVIVNKVNDLDIFENSYAPAIKEMGINIIGAIPYKEQLTYLTVGYLAEKLLARVLAGEQKLKNIVKNIIIGAMSTADPNKNPLYIRPTLNRENQLMITSGDRSDMILAALERDTTGIILTNDIVPPQLILARAKERGVPVLLVPMDTFKAVKTIDDIEALLTKDDPEKIALISQMIEKYTGMNDILK